MVALDLHARNPTQPQEAVCELACTPAFMHWRAGTLEQTTRACMFADHGMLAHMHQPYLGALPSMRPNCVCACMQARPRNGGEGSWTPATQLPVRAGSMRATTRAAHCAHTCSHTHLRGYSAPLYANTPHPLRTCEHRRGRAERHPVVTELRVHCAAGCPASKAVSVGGQASSFARVILPPRQQGSVRRGSLQPRARTVRCMWRDRAEGGRCVHVPEMQGSGRRTQACYWPSPGGDWSVRCFAGTQPPNSPQQLPSTSLYRPRPRPYPSPCVPPVERMSLMWATCTARRPRTRTSRCGRCSRCCGSSWRATTRQSLCLGRQVGGSLWRAPAHSLQPGAPPKICYKMAGGGGGWEAAQEAGHFSCAPVLWGPSILGVG